MGARKRDSRPQEKAKSQRPRTIRLTKSKFCLGSQCLKALYFNVHEPDLGEAVDASQQMIFDQGTEVGIEARKAFPKGVLIDWDHFHSREALEATKEAIALNPPAVFEAAVVHEDVLVRIDILRSNGDGTWDLIEVKSSTSLKDEHIPDLTIQRYVAEKAGLKIRRSVLKHINRDCMFPRLENLFVEVDCSESVAQALASVPGAIKQMFSTLKSDVAPEIDIGPHCDSPYECGFKSHCWSHIPEHSVFELNGVWGSVKFELYGRGIRLIKEINGEKVSRAKPEQLIAVRDNKPVLNRKGLAAFIKQIEYPLYFLDFETINPAIPKYDGLRPYSHLPFQFSCHVLPEQDGKMEHFEFLADGSSDPRPEIGDQLLKILGGKGTILAYNQSFEKSRIQELAAQSPAIAQPLLALLARFIDLKDAFSKYYYHPDFHGSFSIKDVLPVLVPEMSYENLGVNDGGGAQAVYLKLCNSATEQEEKTKCRRDLLEYCKQDTLAMVELLKQLNVLVKGKEK